MILVSNIQKSFGDVQAVRDVSFQADDGSITTFLGANGSGKTTTLRAVAGLLKADGGRVDVDGINVAEHPLEAQRLLGIFPDVFGLYPRLTSREHLSYYGELHGLTGKALDQAIQAVSSLMNMDDILDRRTAGFSQGQRMKVALARAILHRPKNIVLDEPTRGLDVMNIRLLRHILLKLREEGHCVLLSSHVMAEVEAISDHVVLIADGVVCAEGTPQELIEAAGADNLEDAFVTLTKQQDVILETRSNTAGAVA